MTLTIIKKIGEKVLSVVEWPFSHAKKLFHLLFEAKGDVDAVKQACVDLVKHFEALGPDFLEALATKGLNIPADLKCAQDIAPLFAFFRDEFVPVIEKVYQDVKAGAVDLQTPDAPTAPTAPTVDDTKAGISPDQTSAAPGLHNTVPA